MGAPGRESWAEASQTLQSPLGTDGGPGSVWSLPGGRQGGDRLPGSSRRPRGLPGRQADTVLLRPLCLPCAVPNSEPQPSDTGFQVLATVPGASRLLTGNPQVRAPNTLTWGHACVLQGTSGTGTAEPEKAQLNSVVGGCPRWSTETTRGGVAGNGSRVGPREGGV